MRILIKTKEERKLLSKCGIILILLVGLDQLTKYFIVANPELIRKPLVVVPGLFNLVSVRNTGAAWGMFHGNNVLLLFVAFIAFCVLIVFFRSITERCPERYIALSLILSGIVGNSIDRLFRNSVVDFLDFYIGSYHWPAFNVADSAICIGVCLLVLSFLFRKPLASLQDESACPANPDRAKKGESVNP
jgi:signal peptidase II